jgi:predicted methyltransferase
MNKNFKLSVCLYLYCLVVSDALKLFRPGMELVAVRPVLDSSQVGALDHHLAAEILGHLPEGFTPSRKKKSKKKVGEIRDIPKQIIEFQQSIDLGLSKSDVVLDTREGLLDGTSGKMLATVEELMEIARKQGGCYAIFDDGSAPWKISTLSENTGKPASLCPPLEGTGNPTMVLSGFTMHRIVGEEVNPATDTAAKLSALKLFKGAAVLDTCCGLGYTAISAAKAVGADGKVFTIELDEASIEMCVSNPHSRQLFDGTLPIDVLQGNSCDLIHHFKEGVFDAIIHDPPARAICETDLYSEKFYSQLRSRLKPDNGQLFHYIGSPSSTESGRLYSGVRSRLAAAGFVDIRKFPEAFGIVARA